MRHIVPPKKGIGIVFVIALLACLCITLWQNREPLMQEAFKFLIERNINKAAVPLIGQELVFENTSVVIEDGELKFSMQTVLDHVEIAGLDLYTQIAIEGEVYKHPEKPKPVLAALVSSSGTVLNYKPFSEFSGRFNIEDGSLKISSLKLGEEYELSGEYDFYRPWHRDLLVNIKEVDFNELILLAGGAPKKKTVYGPASGHIRISGPSEEIETLVQLRFASGVVKGLPYESMNINLAGEGHLLKFMDSKIFREDGTLGMNGVIDLRKLFAAGNPKKAMDISYESETIIWDGWDISKPLESDEIKMKKQVGSDFRVTFMGYLNNEQSWDATDDGEEVGVEYMLNDNQKMKMRLKKDEEFFSLEHNLKF